MPSSSVSSILVLAHVPIPIDDEGMLCLFLLDIKSGMEVVESHLPTLMRMD